MNSQYLGDALDHWKGSLISILRQERITTRITVEPMFTDDSPWCKEDVQTYSRLLNLGEDDTLCHADTTFHANYGNRQQYFDDVPGKCDLFLDPDTGISNHNGYVGRKYIHIREISQFLHGNQNENRLLMTYQHLARASADRQHRITKDRIKQLRPQAPYCVNQGGQVAMIFISRNSKRIQKIHRILQQHLNGTAVRRIWGNI